MIGTHLLRELVETVILTGRVSSVEPVSLLLIAAPESGKTSVVLEKRCKAVEAFSDVTGKGLHQILKNNKELTHIVINDLVAVLSHKQSVNRYTMSQLNAITEEGISNLASPAGIETLPIGKRGIITSLTLELIKDERHWWSKIGFTSRMLPFCYFYPAGLNIKIKNAIDENAIRGKSLGPPALNGHKKPNFPVPNRDIKVEYPEKIAARVRRLADVRSVLLEEQGMRRLKQYHGIIQAHALTRKKRPPIVTEEDYEFLSTIDYYVNYTKPAPL